MLERVQKELQYWLTDPYFDDRTKEELLTIRNDEAEVTDRFYRDLAFGTGGLRGVVGAGTNRMNIYTVRKATQGLANYINRNGDPKRGVAISYDCRRMSPEFAKETALCLAANGIRVYLSDTLRPVPEESFALRYYHCQAGVEITASHNPPEYNGYKVYWEDGAQITPPHDDGIIADVNAVASYDEVKTMTEEAAVQEGFLSYFGKEIDDAYMEALKTQIIHPDVIRAMADDIRIVYTPFHGTGLVPVTRVLQELGFRHVYVVPEQRDPDPEFTTLTSPNPENPESFELALKLAKEKDADIVLATDPDADRLGVYVKDTKSGEYIGFTGNMSGMLIGEYILRERRLNGTMPENPALVTTIVTTNLAKAVAARYGVHYIEVLTGFKYIGEQIRIFEELHSYHYVFGLEESYGCLPGTHARDKDAPAAVMMLCEAAAFYKQRGLTLWDQMQNIYKEYGYYREAQFSITMKGMEGADKIRLLMERIRSNPPKAFGRWQVEEFRDYASGKVLELVSGKEKETGLPKSNVLYFALSEDAWCCARPSGTEPKIKFYMGVRGTSLTDATAQLEELTKKVRKLAD
ncbi:phosphoglucomutase [Lachnospiraceae bacterium NK3A20]|nr:phosphoglucomutase [Lachnospiraceae bacterium NK3A20]